jgi:hypothetical protein
MVMFRNHRIRQTIASIVGICWVTIFVWCHGARAGEIVIDFLKNDPNNRDGGWTTRLQGIANTNTHWYFSQKKRIWKVPVQYPLQKINKMGNHKKWPLVVQTSMPRVLDKLGYNHFGDLDYARGYLFVPTEGKKKPVIAVFKADTLQFIAYAILPKKSQKKSHAGWCAISNKSTKSELFTSENHINKNSPIEVYRIDWDRLARDKKLIIEFDRNYYLHMIPEKHGSDISAYVQGGDFSDDDKYLFIVNGKLGTKRSDKGVWAFRNNEDRSATFITKSHQDKKGFSYRYQSVSQEPEGLTYWNLDKRIGNTSYRLGQLHVVLLNKIGHKLWIKHYRIQPAHRKLPPSRSGMAQPEERRGSGSMNTR